MEEVIVSDISITLEKPELMSWRKLGTGRPSNWKAIHLLFWYKTHSQYAVFYSNPCLANIASTESKQKKPPGMRYLNDIWYDRVKTPAATALPPPAKTTIISTIPTATRKKKKKKNNKNKKNKTNNKTRTTRATRTPRPTRPTTATNKTTTRRTKMNSEAEEEEEGQPQQAQEEQEQVWIRATTSTTRATTQSKHGNLQRLVPLKTTRNGKLFSNPCCVLDFMP